MSKLIDEVKARAELPPPSLARAIREHAGASQADIGREVGVSRMTVARWEAGTHRPRGAHLVAYAAVLRDLPRGVVVSALVAPAPLGLTVRETARLLQLGERQTYEAVRRGELPVVRIGGAGS